MTGPDCFGALWDAYREAEYVVEREGAPIIVRVGEAVPEMAALPPGFGAVVTAWNPGSRIATPEHNLAASAELAGWIAARGLAALPCRTRAADPAWVEEGWLILGLVEDEAVDLAWRFGQNALVWIATDQPARLVATSLWRATD
jgi:hypothetical protein